jgi:hypothetical protein
MMVFNTLVSYFHKNSIQYLKDYLKTKLTLDEGINFVIYTIAMWQNIHSPNIGKYIFTQHVGQFRIFNQI